MIIIIFTEYLHMLVDMTCSTHVIYQEWTCPNQILVYQYEKEGVSKVMY